MRALAAAPAVAAEFSFVEEDGGPVCAISLGGLDDMLIYAPLGGGIFSGADIYCLERGGDYAAATEIRLTVRFGEDNTALSTKLSARSTTRVARRGSRLPWS